MFIGVRKQKRTYIDGLQEEKIDIWKEAFIQTRIPYERLEHSPYNYAKIEIPDEVFADVCYLDFDDNLEFNIEKYNARKQSISANEEIQNLQYWFDNVYSYKEQKYRRLIALDKLDDDGMSGQEKLEELYHEAETKRVRIQELEPFVIEDENSKEAFFKGEVLK
ncbi:MAG: hypothetical protein ACI4R8_01085 [Candidatus Caccovivens sp.]